MADCHTAKNLLKNPTESWQGESLYILAETFSLLGEFEESIEILTWVENLQYSKTILGMANLQREYQALHNELTRAQKKQEAAQVLEQYFQFFQNDLIWKKISDDEFDPKTGDFMKGKQDALKNKATDLIIRLYDANRTRDAKKITEMYWAGSSAGSSNLFLEMLGYFNN